ncbi:hypothetical protein AB0J72_35945 [Dactylosporangium sp. NPDC049742]|uniref:hypothetical protein n=1 Tax=Dactylosporangium sp. NPDC049742 TaxID=3154737 RepID=UPI003434BB06
MQFVSYVDLVDGSVWSNGPGREGGATMELWPRHLTLGEWLSEWVWRRLYPPWRSTDPVSGEPRLATYEETAAMLGEHCWLDG